MQLINEPGICNMPTPFLESIAQKIFAKERLTAEDGRQLFECKEPDELEAIRQLADYRRKKEVGDTVHYASTLFIHPTNLCELNCTFCSFYAKPGWKTAWFLTPEQIEEKIRAHYSIGLTEVHIVGGAVARL